MPKRFITTEIDTAYRLNDGSINTNFNKIKKLLVISFSGGRTSAYMTKLLIDKYRGIRNILVVFANTGREREETLEFVNNCDRYFNFNTIWIETVMHHGQRKGATYKIVTYETASRNGEPFEEVIKKFGIPSISSIHCTRELKIEPIKKLVRKYGGYGIHWEMAIGIRIDEPKRVKLRDNIIYPMVTEFPTTKLMVNKWWSTQQFDLQLKGYEGNCDLCYKKSKRKLLTILVEHPEFADWWNDMEIKYGNVRYGRDYPFTFYRDNMSVAELVEDSLMPFTMASDDFTQQQLREADPVLDYTNGCEESCEAF